MCIRVGVLVVVLFWEKNIGKVRVAVEYSVSKGIMDYVMRLAAVNHSLYTDDMIWTISNIGIRYGTLQSAASPIVRYCTLLYLTPLANTFQ